MTTAQTAYNKLTALQGGLSASSSMLDLCQGDLPRYERLRSLVLAARAEAKALGDAAYDAYTRLTDTVGGRYSVMSGRTVFADDNEFRIASAFMGLFHGLVLGEAEPHLPTAANLALLVTERDALADEFETRNTTSQADARYGRRTWGTFHKATGTRMTHCRDREGSLGS
jgi:hypothetical protein